MEQYVELVPEGGSLGKSGVSATRDAIFKYQDMFAQSRAARKVAIPSISIHFKRKESGVRGEKMSIRI